MGSGDSAPQLDDQGSKGELVRKDSQTASEFIDGQLQLEAEAREALPYSFEHCTQPLGPLRQNIYSCITCNPPPESATDPYQPAGICYACSISCHGEHTLVELFARRNFTCDCGTTRLPESSPCTLRIDPATGTKGPVRSQAPAEGNIYNQNFRNRFCGCGELYDAFKQRGTMYQCLGLGTESHGGCGEDWWHPECLLGLPRDWHTSIENIRVNKDTSTVISSSGENEDEADDNEHPTPPGFPLEDEFETLICYKCAESNPWMKQYAGSDHFISLAYRVSTQSLGENEPKEAAQEVPGEPLKESSANLNSIMPPASLKRKAEDESLISGSNSPKKAKVESEEPLQAPSESNKCRRVILPTPPTGPTSILAKDENFRSHLCRCPDCYPLLSKHSQLLEVEEVYEPPLSEDGDNADGGGSVGTGSLLDRGEAALSNVDRVRAIEGVMVYNHLKDKVKSFLEPFAQSGKAVGAEDIKAYFEKLRGDAEAISAAGGAAVAGRDRSPGAGDSRKEQSGY